jgi:hypothetical protein
VKLISSPPDISEKGDPLTLAGRELAATAVPRGILFAPYRNVMLGDGAVGRLAPRGFRNRIVFTSTPPPAHRECSHQST